MSAPAAAASLRSNAKVIGLVSTAHFFSHFYLLLLPPLFPLLVDVYGVGYTELGVALAALSLITGLTQAPVGFLVDRHGARGLLMAGLAVEGIAFTLIGVFPFYVALVGLLVVAGLANSVYHPADYAILNASVAPERMGRAFSFHTTAGYLGDALAPVVIVLLITVTDWQTALVVCGLGGTAMAVLLAFHSGVLNDAVEVPEAPPAASPGVSSAAPTRAQPEGPQGVALLLSLPILMGLLFYVGISTYGRGVSSFGPSVLHLAHDAPVATASTIIACYLFAQPAGVLAGGWVADRTTRHDAFCAVCFVMVGLAICSVAAFQPPLWLIGVLFAVAGFCSGMVAPSRDMLIRSLTPPGQVGKVFGFVSTGFNVGGIVAPPLFGFILDHAEPNSVLWITGLVAFATTATVLFTGKQARGLRT